MTDNNENRHDADDTLPDASQLVPLKLASLRAAIDAVDAEIADNVEKRVKLAAAALDLKRSRGMPEYDPQRKQQLVDKACSVFPSDRAKDAVARVVGAAHDACLAAYLDGQNSARHTVRSETVQIGRAAFSANPAAEAHYIAGPCAVESVQQLEDVVAPLAQAGVLVVRGGCWKPRTTPESFQGLGMRGVHMLSSAAHQHGVAAISEVVDAEHAADAAQLLDALQVGARNMQNFALLKAVGRACAAYARPCVLKRSPAATIDEWLAAASYLAAEGCAQIILCERGIRSFDIRTRYCLDIQAVPIVMQLGYPCIVDVSHAAGRRDVVASTVPAAFAAGASGVMVEVHAHPEAALSDQAQQLTLPMFADVARSAAHLASRAPRLAMYNGRP